MKDKLNIVKLRNSTPAEIEAKELELKKALMEARFALANGSIKDTSVISRMRRAIATLKGYATNKQTPKAKADKPAKSAKPVAEKKTADAKKPAPVKKTKEAKNA